MFDSDACPKIRGTQSELMSCTVKFENIILEYYQEMFLRVLSYFTNRFLWALSDSDPYAKPQENQIKQ
jgi:hypothetical protein